MQQIPAPAPVPVIMPGTQPQIMSTIWTKYAANASLGSDEKRNTWTKRRKQLSFILGSESLFFSIAKLCHCLACMQCRVCYLYYYTALFISHLAFSMSGSWQWIMLPTCPQWFLLSCDIESLETCLYMETASVNPCCIEMTVDIGVYNISFLLPWCE